MLNNIEQFHYAADNCQFQNQFNNTNLIDLELVGFGATAVLNIDQYL